jgi:hypothetical protein
MGGGGRITYHDDGIENKQMRAQRSTVLTSLAQLATARDRLAQRSVSERLLTFHRRARPLHHLTASEAVLPSWIVVRLRCGNAGVARVITQDRIQAVAW